MEGPKKPILRGKLIERLRTSTEKPVLHGRLIEQARAAKVEGISVSPEVEGRTVSKTELPDVQFIDSLTARTVIQRDGGRKCVIAAVREPAPGSSKKLVNLVGADGVRITISADTLYDSLTKEGGAWRLLDA